MISLIAYGWIMSIPQKALRNKIQNDLKKINAIIGYKDSGDIENFGNRKSHFVINVNDTIDKMTNEP